MIMSFFLKWTNGPDFLGDDRYVVAHWEAEKSK